MRDPTTLKPSGLAIFDDIVEQPLLGYVTKVSQYGVSPCGNKPPERFRQEAYANVQDNPQNTAAELWGGVLKGRLVAFAVDSEPYTGSLMESKLAYVTQKDVTNPANTKVRYISDPRNEVNERIENDHHPQRIIPRHQNVTRRVLYWKRRYHTVPILICKRDANAAFKFIPVSIRGVAYMGCRFSGFLIMYIALFFGWRPSPANWGLIAKFLMQYVAAYRPASGHRGGPESFISYQYVDDGAFVEPGVGLRPWLSVSLWEMALIACLGFKSLHRVKREVEGRAATTPPLW